jgi:hypothetical protein
MTLDDFVCIACFVAVPAFILALPYILTFFGY